MKKRPDLVPQPHGGALLTGGKPGNKGGVGHPKSEIRAKLRDLFHDDGLEFLQETLQGAVTVTLMGTCANCGAVGNGPTREEFEKLRSSTRDRLAAVDVIARYGVGTQQEVIDKEELQATTERLVTAFRDALNAEVDRDTAERIVARFQTTYQSLDPTGE